MRESPRLKTKSKEYALKASISDLWEELREKEAREGYSEAQFDIEIPCQIEALRRNKGWSIEKLASASGIPVDRLKDIECFELTPSILDLQRIASAFDVGLLIKFAPFSELVRLEESFNPKTFNVFSYDEDALPSHNFFLENRSARSAIATVRISSASDWTSTRDDDMLGLPTGIPDEPYFFDTQKVETVSLWMDQMTLLSGRPKTYQLESL